MKITMTQITAFAQFLKIGGQVLDPVKWKQRAITANYIVAAIPALFVLFNAFNVTSFTITEEDASTIWQICVTLFGISSNVVLAATSRNISMNPASSTRLKSLDDE